MGLLTALDLFVREGDALRHARWLARLKPIADGLRKRPNCHAAIEGEEDVGVVPQLVLTLKKPDASARKVIVQLIKGSPSIHVDPSRRDQGQLVINPLCFDEPDAAPMMERIVAAIG